LKRESSAPRSHQCLPHLIALGYSTYEPRTTNRPSPTGGEGKLEAVGLKEVATGATREVTPAGVFVFIGLTPNTAVVKDTVALDTYGFIETDGTLATSMAGVFAAGDCRAGSTKQAASAAGEGAAVALAIRRYLQPRTSGMPDHGMMMEAATS
jgi:thioredoxin reductase (NADPH)